MVNIQQVDHINDSHPFGVKNFVVFNKKELGKSLHGFDIQESKLVIVLIAEVMNS